MAKRIVVIVVIVLAVAAALAAAHLIVANWPAILEGIKKMHG
jgi:hypothetical protein